MLKQPIYENRLSLYVARNHSPANRSINEISNISPIDQREPTARHRRPEWNRCYDTWSGVESALAVSAFISSDKIK